MHVCVCIYVGIHVYQYLCVSVHTHTHTHMQVWIGEWKNGWMNVQFRSISIHISIWIKVLNTDKYTKSVMPPYMTNA